MSYAAQLARFVLETRYDDLSSEVIHHAKRIILDSIGVAIGGYDGESISILRRCDEQYLRGVPESTIIGSGFQTSCLNATLVNTVMLRYLDFNDSNYLRLEPPVKVEGHYSNTIPGLLAVGEKEGATGKDVITAMVAGYELLGNFLLNIKGKGLGKRGWSNDTIYAPISPLMVGRLMRLNEAELVNAMGISGSFNVALGILDSDGEALTMAKSLRPAFPAYGAVFAALLAKQGLTGPERILEGNGGFIDTVLQGEFDTEHYLKSLSREMPIVMQTAIKSMPAVISTHGHLAATIAVVNENDIKPEDIEKVIITTSLSNHVHAGDINKRYPHNKETADHSLYYLTAIAIIDRELTPDQYDPKKFSDPEVKHLIDRIVIESSEEFEKLKPAGCAEIITKNGTRYFKRVDHPRGHPSNPMTDGEVESKFSRLAKKHFTSEDMERICESVWKFDQCGDLRSFMRMLVFPT